VTAVRVVVDSSGWIEVFTDGPQAERFLEVLQDEASLVVPSITIFEVFRWVLHEHGEADAIQAVAVMQRGQLSHALRLPMADSIILTTARRHQACLYSMDADFQGLDDVELVPRGS
jgi:predicted nucleic acid-binding protein